MTRTRLGSWSHRYPRAGEPGVDCSPYLGQGHVSTPSCPLRPFDAGPVAVPAVAPMFRIGAGPGGALSREVATSRAESTWLRGLRVEGPLHQSAQPAVEGLGDRPLVPLRPRKLQHPLGQSLERETAELRNRGRNTSKKPSRSCPARMAIRWGSAARRSRTARGNGLCASVDGGEPNEVQVDLVGKLGGDLIDGIAGVGHRRPSAGEQARRRELQQGPNDVPALRTGRC